MDIWYKLLGFAENPFSIKPAKRAEALIGHDFQRLCARVEHGGLIFVQGAYGTGKTSLLRALTDRFSGKRVLYYACNRKERNLDFEGLLEARVGLVDSLLGREPRGLILLLDEAQELTREDFRRVYYLFQSDVFRCVVFVSDDTLKVSVPPEFQGFAHCHYHRLEAFTVEQAIRFVRDRVRDLELLTDEVIVRVFCLSGRNPRRLLKLCEQLCRHAVEHDIGRLSVFDVERILDLSPYLSHAEVMGDMRLLPRHQVVSTRGV